VSRSSLDSSHILFHFFCSEVHCTIRPSELGGSEEFKIQNSKEDCTDATVHDHG